MTLKPVLNSALAIGIVLLLILGGAYSYLYRSVEPLPSRVATTTTQTLSDGTIIGGLPEGAVLTEVFSAPELKVPDYRAKVAYGASVTDEVRAVIETRLAADIDLLVANPQNFNAWMDVAVLHKIGGDYRGAEVIWLYATKHWPKSLVPFQNLADLYQNFLNDPAKAKIYADLAKQLEAQ